LRAKPIDFQILFQTQRHVRLMIAFALHAFRFNRAMRSMLAASGPPPVGPYPPVAGAAVKTVQLAPLPSAAGMISGGTSGGGGGGAQTTAAGGAQTMELSSIMGSAPMRVGSASSRLLLPDPIALALRASAPGVGSGTIAYSLSVVIVFAEY
jgi:hypothetical protein